MTSSVSFSKYSNAVAKEGAAMRNFLLCMNQLCCQGLYIPFNKLQYVVSFSNPWGRKKIYYELLHLVSIHLQTPPKSKSSESWEVSLRNCDYMLPLFLQLFFKRQDIGIGYTISLMRNYNYVETSFSNFVVYIKLADVKSKE